MGVHDDLNTMLKKQRVWPQIKLFWHGKEYSTRDSERNLVFRSLEGSGVPTTVKVKELRWEMHDMLSRVSKYKQK